MYHAQIAVAENGNLSVRVLPTAPEFLPHPTFPPVALPAHEFPNALAAQSYTEALLSTAGVITPAQHARGLAWISAGYTLSGGARHAVRTAPIPQD